MNTILFDWGGVCCKEGEPFASVELQRRLGGRHPNDLIAELKDIYYDFYRGKYETDVFWRLALERFNLTEDTELNPAKLSQSYLESYEVWPDVLETAGRLRAGYKVGLLSDLTPVMKDHISATHDLDRYFDEMVFSCDQGVNAIKNDGPKIFDVILERFSAAPEDCLFIDNSQSKIDVAAGMGMKGILFKDREQFFRDIQQI